MTDDQLKSLRAALAKLRDLADTLVTSEHALHAPTKLQNAIRTGIDDLSMISSMVDPILEPGWMFDPSNPSTAAKIVAIALSAQPRRPLLSAPKMYGSGVYAIYYKGKFPAYAKLSGTEHPIYVGKADPKDPAASTSRGQGTTLYGRLRDHAKSIQKASSTLSIEDFDYRMLVVQSGYQKSAEEYLIRFFWPIWNVETNICYGIGKHGDAATTRGNKRSPWDTLHPGRKWASATEKDQKSVQEIKSQISKHLQKPAPFKSTNVILENIMKQLKQV